MLVCEHGDVFDFCKEHDMTIAEIYDGDLRDYNGACRVLVTSADLSENEYYFLKRRLLGRGVELVSTKHRDDEKVVGYIRYESQRAKRTYGRQRFGFRMENGVVIPILGGVKVVRRVLDLHDAGYTLRQIQADNDVHHPDGRPGSVSTIQAIIKRRKEYEDYGR